MQPINVIKWIENNKDRLKPPVCNQVIWNDTKDFIVMVVGGPNNRNDFHINKTEELFYQYKGDMCLRVVKDNVFEDILIQEGDLFLLPGNIPHLPIRKANTIGIVVEKIREKDQKDGFAWYCQKCQNQLHLEQVCVKDIVTQLPIIFKAYNDSESKRTCKKCGYLNPKI